AVQGARPCPSPPGVPARPEHRDQVALRRDGRDRGDGRARRPGAPVGARLRVRPRAGRAGAARRPRPVIHRLEREQLVARPPREVFTFFARAHNLEAITPLWLRFQVLTPDPVAMSVGTLIEYRLRLHGLPLRWLTRIEEWQADRAFVDRQLRGPY